MKSAIKSLSDENKDFKSQLEASGIKIEDFESDMGGLCPSSSVRG
ncbi:hypothetical protein BLA23254_06783 [Burkholderia lata]|uniref:Uncharacterized protein n=1 Tax=Burkholderia lata (strain ATCC 17760 / DSM 23089 / LMG 22485 / NCIMB 9086 / R18194 / 383) TaxID=482957 RepID=A0A6P2S6D0_BURL3|nr:hypothetical protein BLA23254_06783 [Burkholderia lata]